MSAINRNEGTIAQVEKVNHGGSQFCKDIVNGLRATAKHLQSKYFYDTEGDRLFQKIMHCDEYYPFRCELEIFKDKASELARAMMETGGPFDLIELGAGDGTKSGYLLRKLIEQGADFAYRPIDISANIIEHLERQLPMTIPGITIEGLHGEYFDMLEKAVEDSKKRKIILFLGSNLGNMPVGEAQLFCRILRSHMLPGDLALIGLDLKKNPAVILAAYNDKAGITRDFNLNLLHRINRELSANFDVSQFEHYPTYDPATGTCKSYLISLKDQAVTLNTPMGKETIHFKKDEHIFMEISQKYTVDQVAQLGTQASFETVDRFFDHDRGFIDTLWKAV